MAFSVLIWTTNELIDLLNVCKDDRTCRGSRADVAEGASCSPDKALV